MRKDYTPVVSKSSVCLEKHSPWVWRGLGEIWPEVIQKPKERTNCFKAHNLPCRTTQLFLNLIPLWESSWNSLEQRGHRTSWVLLGGVCGHRGAVDVLLSCAHTMCWTWPVTAQDFLHPYTNYSSLHPSDPELGWEPLSPCFLARIEQFPAHSRCQITPRATPATITPPALQRALQQMGWWADLRRVCPNILANWAGRNTGCLSGRIFSKFSSLSAKPHNLHPRKPPVNCSRRYCMKG